MDRDFDFSSSIERCRCLRCLERPDRGELKQLFHTHPFVSLKLVSETYAQSIEEVPPTLGEGTIFAFHLIILSLGLIFVGLLSFGLSPILVVVLLFTMAAINRVTIFFASRQ